MTVGEIEPNDLLLYARVADAGSFSQAAQRLGLPKSTVSRRIAELERRLGERLMLRTTRKLSLTDFGRQLLEQAHAVSETVAAVTSFAQNRQVVPSGRLRVSMPGEFTVGPTATIIERFVAQHPQVVLSLDLTSRVVDIIGEGFDLAIRVGALPDDATLAARRLVDVPAGLYAAPSLLERHGVPREPDDLRRLPSLLMESKSGEGGIDWTLTRRRADGGIDAWTGAGPPRCTANSLQVLTLLALAGHGVTWMQQRVALSEEAAGRLVRVLPDWSPQTITAWAVFPGRRLMPSKTRAFIQALQRGLGIEGPDAELPGSGA
ncbi:MAG TPA: LysR family transcriptional regulator [Burkholderiaceae bacterium]|nr:LysR family transcriptional regulator [Burkholderiaceae bacterium]